ncbi:MAG: AEC family transporter [Alphaproteobacteria bacterium]|nr:MAG: AEC family transporter [Alphaproteobacteria bacterium]
MSAAFEALLPIFLVILAGYGLRVIKFTTEEAWRLVERIVYFVLFPALILNTLALADLASLQILPMAGALLSALMVAAFVLTVMRRTVGGTIGLTGPAYSSVFQGSLRWNGFVALASVGAIFGADGVTAAALAIAVLVPTVNVLSVLILSRHAADQPSDAARILKLLSRNPLILACLVGLGLNFSGIHLPGPLQPTTDLLGRAALTLGLLSVGAGLDIRSAMGTKTLVVIACSLKLLVIPIMVALFCQLYGVEGLTRQVAIMCGAVPTASSSYVLARQLGGDHTLMAAIITVSTLIALISLPLTIAWVS